MEKIKRRNRRSEKGIKEMKWKKGERKRKRIELC